MTGDDEVIVTWEVTRQHTVRLPRAEVLAQLGHTAEQLAHRPIIDEHLHPGDPLFAALAGYEDPATDQGPQARLITDVTPAGDG